MFLAKPLLADTQQLLQLIDYVGVDYSGAVIDGQIEITDKEQISRNKASIPKASASSGMIGTMFFPIVLSRNNVSVETRLIDRHDRTQSHRYSGRLIELFLIIAHIQSPGKLQ